MTEVVSINLENEMDLILSHKRSMKLAELCGLSVLVQTSFATAVSEISRCVINNNAGKSVLKLGITDLVGSRKALVAALVSENDFGQECSDAVKYATRLTDEIKFNKNKKGSEVVISQKINFGGLINTARIESFITYFKRELPLSPYDELRKKNIQLLEISDKLKESEQQYRILSETLPLMVFTLNGTGHLTYANKWLRDYFNLVDIQPGKLQWLSLIHTSDHKTVHNTWEKAQGLQNSFSTQARLKTKNNEPLLWHLLSFIPVKNDSGQVVSWTGFFVDINAQKLVEETLKNNVELQQAQKQLLNYQSKLVENVKELNKSNHDLEQFAYIASHDLQEPLRKIRNFTEQLENCIEDPLKAKKYLAKIDTASSRMAMLISDVLNYSRLSKSEISFEDVDLQQVVKNVKADLELIIEEKKAIVTADVLPVISGLAQQLHQLFYNLLSNALKFNTGRPEIDLTCRSLTAEEITQPDLHKNTAYVEVVVKDNGIGFEQKHARQIFTIFKRLNSKETFEGTGIGLALCKKIVDNHHGLIEANSEPGKGTEFRIILPVS